MSSPLGGGPLPPGVRRLGYLRKQKHGHRRFFVLREVPARLEYYDSEKKWRAGASPRRRVALETCLCVSKRADAKNRHLVALYTRDEYFAVAADSEQERDAWFRALAELVAACSSAPPGLEEPGYGGPLGPLAPPPYQQCWEVWQVQVKSRGLGQSRGLTGVHRLCLTARALSFVRPNSDVASASVQLTHVRRCGHSDGFFFLDLGRSASTGAGELWMQAGDAVVAANIHETVLDAMRQAGDADGFRPRSKSQSTGSAPVAIAARHHHQRHHNFQPAPPRLGRHARNGAGSPPGSTPGSTPGSLGEAGLLLGEDLDSPCSTPPSRDASDPGGYMLMASRGGGGGGRQRTQSLSTPAPEPPRALPLSSASLDERRLLQPRLGYPDDCGSSRSSLGDDGYVAMTPGSVGDYVPMSPMSVSAPKQIVNPPEDSGYMRMWRPERNADYMNMSPGNANPSPDDHLSLLVGEHPAAITASRPSASNQTAAITASSPTALASSPRALASYQTAAITASRPLASNQTAAITASRPLASNQTAAITASRPAMASNQMASPTFPANLQSPPDDDGQYVLMSPQRPVGGAGGDGEYYSVASPLSPTAPIRPGGGGAYREGGGGAYRGRLGRPTRLSLDTLRTLPSMNEHPPPGEYINIDFARSPGNSPARSPGNSPASSLGDGGVGRMSLAEYINLELGQTSKGDQDQDQGGKGDYTHMAFVPQSPAGVQPPSPAAILGPDCSAKVIRALPQGRRRHSSETFASVATVTPVCPSFARGGGGAGVRRPSSVENVSFREESDGEGGGKAANRGSDGYPDSPRYIALDLQEGREEETGAGFKPTTRGDLVGFKPKGSGDLVGFEPKGSGDLAEFKPTTTGNLGGFKPTGSGELVGSKPTTSGNLAGFEPKGSGDLVGFEPTTSGDLTGFKPTTTGNLAEFKPTTDGDQVGIKPTGSGELVGSKPTTSGNLAGFEPKGSGNQVGIKSDLVGFEPTTTGNLAELKPTTSGDQMGFKPTTSGDLVGFKPNKSGELVGFKPTTSGDLVGFKPTTSGDLVGFKPTTSCKGGLKGLHSSPYVCLGFKDTATTAKD